MNKNNYLKTSALGLVLAVSGCSYLDRSDNVSEYAGNAQAINEAKMVEDPWNENAYNNVIEGNGQRLGQAVSDYKKDETEVDTKIKNIGTTD